jgi:hypothetical protein
LKADRDKIVLAINNIVSGRCLIDDYQQGKVYICSKNDKKIANLIKVTIIFEKEIMNENSISEGKF